MKGGWKKIAADVEAQVKADGTALVTEQPVGPGSDFDPTDAPTLTQEGRGVTAKQVSDWLYASRKWTHDADCVWAWYDETVDKTHVGLGKMKKAAPMGVLQEA